jgi:hypothetical protein
MKTGCDQALWSAPPGSRTQNLRIKSPAQPVRPLLSSPQNRAFVRLAVQGVLPNPPQSGEFVAKLVARLRASWRRPCLSLANLSLPRSEHCGKCVIVVVVERWVLVVAVVGREDAEGVGKNIDVEARVL